MAIANPPSQPQRSDSNRASGKSEHRGRAHSAATTPTATPAPSAPQRDAGVDPPRKTLSQKTILFRLFLGLIVAPTVFILLANWLIRLWA